ncbi:sce7726 family protein [Thermomonas sp.]|uniref:sce7726 family protein n=1 Tax=Thermomonas sp. TaxID=1971895 RepID=UPI002487F55C|nr:sce7726 family protein [Thermomonas sp.]MDI1254134.1 sce7726 family protein [Thermomonas sp.]
MSFVRHRVTEQELRQALATWFTPRLAAGDLLVEEMGIENGTARVDVAQLGSSLCGFEIKSDFDTLDRLAHQMHAYHRVFDELTIVTTAAFVPQVSLLLAPWWGILQAERTDSGEVSLTQVRPPDFNPRQELESIAALLWRDEAAVILRDNLGAKVASSANRAKLYRQLADLTELATLKKWVIEVLRSRTSLRERDLLRFKSAHSIAAPSERDDDLRRLAAMS